MATTVKTLKDSGKTNDILPRTQINAIFDTDGNYLSGDLKASDLNPLKDGALDKVPICEDGVPGTPIPTDADTLEGHSASYFATAEAVTSLISLIWTNPNPTSDFPAQDINIDLSPYKLVVILCGEYKGSSRHQLTVGICPVGESCTVFAPYISYDSSYDQIRNYTARHISTTTSKITVGNTYADTSGVHNYGNCLPLFIYGIK